MRELVFRVSVGVLYGAAVFVALRLARQVEGGTKPLLVIAGTMGVAALVHHLILRWARPTHDGAVP